MEVIFLKNGRSNSEFTKNIIYENTDIKFKVKNWTIRQR